MSFKLEYKRFGPQSLLIEWPHKISEEILDDVLSFKLKLEQFEVKSFNQITSAYNSLLVNYEDDLIDFNKEKCLLESIYFSEEKIKKTESTLWKVPVCYDESFGIDLGTISKEKGMRKQDVIKLHSQHIYTVYFIGFLPGFLYLGGLNEALTMPRKSSPRLKVDKGAVAIGGNQTGVYPVESPGGWNIIGNSPINFFDIEKVTPCFAKAGDKIQFFPISLKEYQDIKTLVKANVYSIEEINVE